MEKWIQYDKMAIDAGSSIEKISFEKDQLVIGVKKGSIEKNVIFEDIYAYKYSNESGIIDRVSKVPVEILRKNKVFLVEESDYLKEYEFQSSGTRPMEEVRHFVLLDGIDTVVEVLAMSEPKIVSSTPIKLEE